MFSLTDMHLILASTWFSLETASLYFENEVYFSIQRLVYFDEWFETHS